MVATCERVYQVAVYVRNYIKPARLILTNTENDIDYLDTSESDHYKSFLETTKRGMTTA